MADTNEWIVIVYKLPSHPSRIRVHVWRALKKIGALYYQQGVAMLPRSEHFLEFMQELRSEIDAFDGDAVLANFNFMYQGDNKHATDEFNASLSREYVSIEETGNKIWDEIESNRKANLLTLSYLEECLSMLNKLKKSYETVKLRDCFKIRLLERIDEHIETLLKKVQSYYNDFKKSPTAIPVKTPI